MSRFRNKYTPGKKKKSRRRANLGAFFALACVLVLTAPFFFIVQHMGGFKEVNGLYIEILAGIGTAMLIAGLIFDRLIEFAVRHSDNSNVEQPEE